MVETLSKTTLVAAICCYTFLGAMLDVEMGGGDDKNGSNGEIQVVNPTSYYGSPIGLVMKIEQPIEKNRTYISVANRSGKWLLCDFGDGNTIELAPEDNDMQLLPMPVYSKKIAVCVRS